MDYLGHHSAHTDAVVLVPAAHDKFDPLEAGLPHCAEHLVGGLELGVTLDHRPAQAVRRRDDVAPANTRRSI